MRRTYLVAVLVLASCAAPEPRALSTSEAERLASMRLNNYDTKVAEIRARVPTGAGTLVLTGRVDFVDHTGYATLRTEGRDDPASAGVVRWDLTQLAFRQGPADDWQYRALQRAGSELDATLLLLVNIAADRPDNAQLLQQSSARWLRSEILDGVAVDVFEGPDGGRLTYWLDANGKLLQLHARLGDQAEPAVIQLGPAAAPITPLPS